MISRLMLSLKKVSRVRGSGWTSDSLSRTHARTVTQIEFEPPPTDPHESRGTTSHELELSTFSERQDEERISEGAV